MMRTLYEISSWAKTYQAPFLGAGLAFLVSCLVALVQWSNLALIYFFGVLVAAFFWVLGFACVNSWLAISFVKARFKKPKVGILTTNDEKTKGVSEAYTASDWKASFGTNANFRDIRPTDDVSVGLDVIVNPLLEHYPEIDLANQIRLKALTDIIQKGGVVVATGGLPFFWMLDSHDLFEGAEAKSSSGGFLNFYVLTKGAKFVPGFDPRQASLLDTWLYRVFGVMTTIGGERDVDLQAVDDKYFCGLVSVDSKKTVEEFRAPFRCDSKEAKLIPIVKADWDFEEHKQECYPVAAVKYGIGYLIIFGMKLRKEDKVFVSDVNVSILKRLREKGCLD